MSDTHFVKNIAGIFNNSNLSDSVKYDLCSKLVCEYLDAHSVSLMMYDGENDDLCCFGNYIATTSIQHTNKESEGQEIIYDFFQNLMIYNFFRESGNNMYSDYLNHYGITDSKGERKRFEKTKTKWTESKGMKHIKHILNTDDELPKNYINLFQNFNALIHSERCEISSEKNKSITGNFFFNLVSKSFFPKKILKKNLSTSRIKNQERFGIFNDLALSILPSTYKNRFYVGLPLFANNCYFGILRVILGKPKMPVREFDERATNISQILSLHINSDIYLKIYQKLASLKIDPFPHNNLATYEIEDTLNAVVSILNCNGCLINLQGGDDFVGLKGTSNSLKPYSHYISKKEADNSSVDSMNIFETLGGFDGNEVLAINFSLPIGNSNQFETIEYYVKNRKLKAKASNRKFQDFDLEYFQVLNSLKMHHFVMAKLDYFDKGFMIFTNTRNRPFTKADIEIVLIIAKK